ncbi:MAG: ADP-ribosylglycohydrolase family protein [Clostridia bacterium]|nr:ADP-ribosylglycohydrolase family protein [Clostridia bacterium]
MRNIWKDGVMGVITGDALGCPVQFETRQEVAERPVTGMRGYGSFSLPSGTWTDDGSLTLALLESLRRLDAVDLNDIMGNFVQWLDHGAFTPFGYAFDIGGGTMSAICRFKREKDPLKSGGPDVWNNGNGSLMRILPACIFCVEKGLDDASAIRIVHEVGSLTHAHIRANIACGLYFFMAREILNGDGALNARLQKGLSQGFAFYEASLADQQELRFFDRLRDLEAFAALPADRIESSGYVVDTLEAAIWSLATADSFEAALLKAVNLGEDSDTVGAVAGGLAGLFYGFEAIPAEWVRVLQRREWIEKLCEERG